MAIKKIIWWNTKKEIKGKFIKKKTKPDNLSQIDIFAELGIKRLA